MPENTLTKKQNKRMCLFMFVAWEDCVNAARLVVDERLESQIDAMQNGTNVVRLEKVLGTYACRGGDWK